MWATIHPASCSTAPLLHYHLSRARPRQSTSTSDGNQHKQKQQAHLRSLHGMCENKCWTSPKTRKIYIYIYTYIIIHIYIYILGTVVICDHLVRYLSTPFAKEAYGRLWPPPGPASPRDHLSALVPTIKAHPIAARHLWRSYHGYHGTALEIRSVATQKDPLLFPLLFPLSSTIHWPTVKQTEKCMGHAAMQFLHQFTIKQFFSSRNSWVRQLSGEPK